MANMCASRNLQALAQHFSTLKTTFLLSDYKFLFLEVGGQGRLSDGAIWNSSRMKTHLDNNSLHIPGPSNLPKMRGSSFHLPHYFAAHDAFGMTENIMKPYSAKDLTQAQRVFNYRYSISVT